MISYLLTYIFFVINWCQYIFLKLLSLIQKSKHTFLLFIITIIYFMQYWGSYYLVYRKTKVASLTQPHKNLDKKKNPTFSVVLQISYHCACSQLLSGKLNRPFSSICTCTSCGLEIELYIYFDNICSMV